MQNELIGSLKPTNDTQLWQMHIEKENEKVSLQSKEVSGWFTSDSMLNQLYAHVIWCELQSPTPYWFSCLPQIMEFKCSLF